MRWLRVRPLQPKLRSEAELSLRPDRDHRYIGHDEAYARVRGIRRGFLEGQVAVAKCRLGDAAAAIPILERELTKQNFTLSARG